MFYELAQFVTRIGLAFWYKLVYINKANIPKDRGAIVASNHVCAADPILVSYGVKQQLHYMAKKEIFSNPFFSMVLRWLNVFAVDRGAGDGDALQYAVELINNKKVMGIFPEGTRSKDGNLLRPKSGMALVAYRTGADIIPAAIYYTNGSKFRSKVYLCFGERILFEDLGLTEGKPNELKCASRQVMVEIAALRDRCIAVSQSKEV
ncbi:MAG: lysophospholipid acyltransferase family protein [Oscillospiraceae bacterium]